MKVLYHYDVGPWLRDRLNRMAREEGLRVVICSERDQEGFLEQMAETDVLLHNLEPVKEEHMAAAPKLKLVQKIGVGVNTIDLDAAKERGIAVCNMPGTNSQAVSEMTLLLMLACLRRLPVFHARTARGDGWGWPPAMQDTLGEIAGKTVGLVGNGSVPQLLTPVLEAMGAKVIFTKRGTPDPSIPAWVDKPTLLAQSDIVSLHIPLVEETRHWLDRDAISHMKPGAILVNTARGPLVDEEALAAALSSGRIMGAGLDVFAEEPSPANNPLFKLDNVVLAPHVAFFTLGTLERSLAVVSENISRLRDGRELLHRVV